MDGKAWKIAVEHAKLKDHEYPISYSTTFLFFGGTVCLHLARRGCRGYKRRAASETRRTKAFVRLGVVNFTHLLLLLEAEM